MPGPGRPFVKGQSGNPSGRTKADKTITQLAREAAPDALRTLVKIMRDPKMPPGARAVAADHVINRAYGKPPQLNTVNAEQFKRAVEMTDDELARIAAGAEPVTVDPVELTEDSPSDPTQIN